jgi:hypothetical protein
MNLSTKKLVCFGLVGGTLFSFNAPAIAQIQVTGGDFSGAAGFFLPDMVDVDAGKNVKLLDATVETLNLESTNGNTSTAVFTPTAARFDNNIDPTMATVDVDDTGALQGLLTGLAFDSNGYPVIFTGVSTRLDFAVNSFETSNSLMGTLIQPEIVGAAPLVFINQDVALTADSDTDFEAVKGQLDVGTLDASLMDGELDLPNDWYFEGEAAGGGSNPSLNLERRIKFQFYGDDVLAADGTDLDTSDDEIRFIGAANQKFQIQTVGTRSSAEFKIKADGVDDAFVDITLGGPFSKIKGDSADIDLTQELDYKIKGEAEGTFTALLGNISAIAGFEGTARRDVDFDFKQGGDKFSGRSDGSVNFLAAVGNTELIDNGDGDTTVGLGVCNVCIDDETGNNPPTTVATSIRFLSIEDLLNDTSDDPDDTLLSDDEYEALEEQLAEVNIDIDIDVDITVIDKGLDRYYVAYHNKGKGKYKGKGRGKQKKGYYENEVFCFRQVGPGSSIFPGLIGLVQIDFDDIPIEIFVGLPEIADADIDDDTDTDTDVDVDDSDTGSDSDSDDDSDDDDDDSDDDDDDDDDDDSDSDDDDDDDDSDSDDDDDVIIIEGLPEIDDNTDSGSDSGDSGSDDSGSDSSSSDDVIIIEGLPEIQ